jgi:hypothetical protein
MLKISKEEIEEIKKTKGNVSGEKFYTTFPYLERREKDNEVKQVLDAMKELGYPINLKEINSSKRYPIKISLLLFVVAKDIFNWKDEDIFEMGRYAPKVSFVTRILLRNLVSIRTIFNKAPDTWKNHYDFGSLEAVEIDEEKRHLIVRVKDFNVHPIMCPYHGGYFQAMAEFCIKEKQVNTKETKCIHRGDDYHEYFISWK